MSMSRTAISSLALIALIWSPPLTAQATKLLRFPDLHDERVVFTYAGDLWLAPAVGGDAVRLTTHPGLELFAKFSPDGHHIAFTGQYDGDEQVYVVPSRGGEPRRLTHYPAVGPLPPRWGTDNQVHGWTPDGEAVLVRSMRDAWDLGATRLYAVPLAGGQPEALPMPRSGAGALSPDGQRVLYAPLARDFRHWKRYAGGWAQDLHIFDLATFESRRITDHPRSDRDPMWMAAGIFFSSDRSGVLNLYTWDPESGEARALTEEREWDVRWPSDDGAGRIVFERAGELEILDTRTSERRRLAIRVPTDALPTRPSRVAAGRHIEGFGLAPKGQRALFAARGDIFSVPIEHGPTRHLTRSPGAHDRAPAWSPDGRWVAFVSDLSGEEEIYRLDPMGGEPERLTELAAAGHRGLFDGLVFSPHGRRLAFRDQGGRLFLLEVESRELTLVADDPVPFGLTYDFSPHGAFLAYSLEGANGLRSIHLYEVASGESHRLTSELWNEHSPAFSRDGTYLFYLSDRELRPQLGSLERNYVLDRETRVYGLALRQDVPHLFPPRSDEVEMPRAEEKGSEEAEPQGRSDTGDAAPDEQRDAPIVIELDGLAERVVPVPLEADNYLALTTADGHLILARGGATFLGRSNGRPVELVAYSLEERSEKTLVQGVQGLAQSSDGSKLLVSTSGGYRLIDATGGGKNGQRAVSTAGLVVERVPREEWAQIFDEVWRRFRDFFYDPALHGYDWDALRARYRPLLEHLGHRSDLTYVLTEMIAELNVSHAYVAGGDFEAPERPTPGLLGARFEHDPEAGRYRVAEVFAGHNEESRYRSPLTEVGVDVGVGDWLLAIGGEELTAHDNPFRLLRHAGPGPVELLVSDRPSLEGARRVLVEPVSREDDLLYLRWIEGNRRYVDEKTEGRVGYLHLPDMGSRGLSEWIKWFYGQRHKAGLVIDIRGNGGGNVSEMIIERLRRGLLALDFERHRDTAEPYPADVYRGHLVCVIDETTASDGDQFAWAFREAELGPLVGKRTWGGVVGIYGRTPLIDGGSVSVPEAGSADASGRWVIEGYGVDPDHVVELDPKALLEGRDTQLDKAIELVLEAVERQPRPWPERPPGPVKTE